MPPKLAQFLRSKSFWSILFSVAYNLLALQITNTLDTITVESVSTGAIVFRVGGEWVADAMRALGLLREDE